MASFFFQTDARLRNIGSAALVLLIRLFVTEYREMRWDLLIVMMLVGSTECLGAFIRPLCQLRMAFALRSVRARSG